MLFVWYVCVGADRSLETQLRCLGVGGKREPECAEWQREPTDVRERSWRKSLGTVK